MDIEALRVALMAAAVNRAREYEPAFTTTDPDRMLYDEMSNTTLRIRRAYARGVYETLCAIAAIAPE